MDQVDIVADIRAAMDQDYKPTQKMVRVLLKEYDRLTALCDGYRGEVEAAKAETDRLLNQNRKLWAILNGAGIGMYSEEEAKEQLRHYADVDARIDGMVSALTRARADGMKEAIKSADDVPATVSVYPTFEQARGAASAKEQIIAAIRERATKGDSDEG